MRDGGRAECRSEVDAQSIRHPHPQLDAGVYGAAASCSRWTVLTTPDPEHVGDRPWAGGSQRTQTAAHRASELRGTTAVRVAGIERKVRPVWSLSLDAARGHKRALRDPPSDIATRPPDDQAACEVGSHAARLRVATRSSGLSRGDDARELQDPGGRQVLLGDGRRRGGRAHPRWRL